MSIVHEHDGDSVTAQATPSTDLRTRLLKSQNLFIPTDRLAHVLGLKHWHQLAKHWHAVLHLSCAVSCESNRSLLAERAASSPTADEMLPSHLHALNPCVIY